MATAYQNLSEYDFNSVPDASEMSIGIVVAEWNKLITEKLLEGACNTLEKHGVKEENILVERVPGSFELTFGAKHLAENHNLDAVIVLGCVIQGDTPHFNYVCSGVTQGITELNLMYDIPFIFGGIGRRNFFAGSFWPVCDPLTPAGSSPSRQGERDGICRYLSPPEARGRCPKGRGG